MRVKGVLVMKGSLNFPIVTLTTLFAICMVLMVRTLIRVSFSLPPDRNLQVALMFISIGVVVTVFVCENVLNTVSLRHYRDNLCLFFFNIPFKKVNDNDAKSVKLERKPVHTGTGRDWVQQIVFEPEFFALRYTKWLSQDETWFEDTKSKLTSLGYSVEEYNAEAFHKAPSNY